jgi:GAF domain-containing protein
LPENPDIPDPITDLSRLVEVSTYDFESPQVREKLHEFARRAAQRLGEPIGAISIVLDTAQFFAGMYGVPGWIAEAEGMPIEWSMCAHAVASGRPYIVEDGANHPVHHDNPVVAVDGARCYAGAPLISPSGQVLGACCVIGVEPRTFNADDIAYLERLASEVVGELGRHRIINKATV